VTNEALFWKCMCWITATSICLGLGVCFLLEAIFRKRCPRPWSEPSPDFVVAHGPPMTTNDDFDRCDACGDPSPAEQRTIIRIQRRPLGGQWESFKLCPSCIRILRFTLGTPFKTERTR
jgi:hypothetical protein